MPDTHAIRAFLNDSHLDLAARAAEFAEASVGPLPAVESDADARLRARQVLELLGGGGWCRYAVPAEFGGVAEEIDLRACCLIREALAAVSPLADAVFALQCLGSRPLAMAGNAELKTQWLPRVASGEAMAAFAMTEAEAGSDVAGMKTSATRDGDEYVLEGGKIFISNAGLADFYTVFAVTGEREGGRAEISAFVVPAEAEGLRFVRPQVMSAPHPLGEIGFEHCRIPVTSRLGAEGDGFKLGMRTLDRLRTTVAAAACGMASRALSAATSHALERRQFGRPLADFQLVQGKLARMAIDLEAARLLVYRAAWEADGGAGRVTMASAMAKAFATEAAQRIVDDAIQILGGQGVLADHPVDLLYRSVRALRIYEGATDIQYLVIARHLLADAGRSSGGE